MNRWHILASDARSGRAVYDDLIGHGFTRIKVHSNQQTAEGAGQGGLSTGDTPVLSSASVGRMASAVSGATDPDPAMTGFESEIEAGQVLLIVDFPEERIAEMRSLVQQHPSARSPEGDAG